jgi:hypothetical protein
VPPRRQNHFFAKAFTDASEDKVNTWRYMSIGFVAPIELVAWHKAILTTTIAGASLIVADARLET